MASHRYTASGDSQQSHDGAAFTWILDHVLTYPGTYELPLRTMYTLNSSPRAQPLPTHSRSGSNNSNSSTSSYPNFSRPQPHDSDAASHFKSALMSQISSLPTQPCSLPPSFLSSFIRKCFTVELETVDFPQALTGMDYLKDLELRRQREVAAAFRRLGVVVKCADGRSILNEARHPAVDEWVRQLEKKERKVEQIHALCYISLRRWVSHSLYVNYSS
jgi:hypothetical protein